MNSRARVFLRLTSTITCVVAGALVAGLAAAFRSGAAATTYEGARLTEFLAKHQAPYLKAETLVNEALSRAKKEQKTLFVWFSARW